MPQAPAELPRFLRPLFLIVDLGFIAYWAITLAGVIPDEYLFKDYDNPILSAWNWSFLPLDLAISASGLTAWWLPNLFLLLYPLWFLPKLMRAA
jgi:hypothetical protein